MKKYITSFFLYIRVLIAVRSFGKSFLHINRMRKADGTTPWFEGIPRFGQQILDAAQIEIELSGYELGEGSHVIAMNHQALIDVALAAVISKGKPCTALAAKKIRRIPFIGTSLELFDTVFLDRAIRNDRTKIKALADSLGDRNLIVFPEGTRSQGIGHFKKGWLHIAIQNENPIVPVYILGKHKKWLLEPQKIFIIYGTPVSTVGIRKTTMDTFLEKFHANYKATYEKLYEKYKPHF